MVGALVLALVALAAISVPGVIGRRLIGSPVAQTIPAPPSVGDCVTAISPVPPIDPGGDVDIAAAYPSASFGSCTGPIVGEVMSVDPSAHAFGNTTLASYELAGSVCELSEVNYVGSIGPFDPATITTPGIAWQADVTVESVAIGPTALQRAGGQSWTACLGATPDRSAYRGRISGALAGGVLPPAFATCWRSLKSATEQQTEDQQIPCSRPHPIEVIALTQITDATTTTAQVSKSYLGMAARALRTSDPTRGGRLKIAAYSMDGSSVLPLTTAAMFQGYLGCIASVGPPNRLDNTLIGVGSKPLPIVN